MDKIASRIEIIKIKLSDAQRAYEMIKRNIDDYQHTIDGFNEGDKLTYLRLAIDEHNHSIERNYRRRFRFPAAYAEFVEKQRRMFDELQTQYNITLPTRCDLRSKITLTHEEVIQAVSSGDNKIPNKPN